MKRYHAYCGDVYYPSGGYEDFCNDFDSKEEAVSAVIVVCRMESVLSENELWNYSWAHVVDAETKKIVWESE